MTRLVSTFGILSLIALSSCVEAPPSGPVGKTLSDAERADCLLKGGTVGRGGLLANEICTLPQPDAGKSCAKQSDCSGMCLADTKTCSPVTPMFGCFEFLDETGQKVGICID